MFSHGPIDTALTLHHGLSFFDQTLELGQYVKGFWSLGDARP